MARKPLRPCRHPGCTRLVSGGYCPEHQPPKAARQVSAQWHDWYSLKVWTDDLRPEQLRREPFCRECAREGKRVYATVADHVKPHRGDWALFTDRSNLQSLCKRHHDRKTALEKAENRRRSGR